MATPRESYGIGGRAGECSHPARDATDKEFTIRKPTAHHICNSSHRLLQRKSSPALHRANHLPIKCQAIQTGKRPTYISLAPSKHPENSPNEKHPIRTRRQSMPYTACHTRPTAEFHSKQARLLLPFLARLGAPPFHPLLSST